MSSWWPEPYGGRDRYSMMPSFDRFLGHMMDMERPFGRFAPYWMEQNPVNQCNIGNTVGKVVDDTSQFSVELDVSQFRPDELQVNIRNQELIVEGHHEQRNDAHGSIERHFIRKFTVPKEANLEALASHLNEKGVLMVKAPKQAVEGQSVRKIPIQAAPRNEKMIGGEDKMVEGK